ncbi:MAG: HTTM domain-containing protein [Rhizobacter sp.]|nr:HTTM domain-containing protein [Chlorobiales bacterium]
MAAVPNSIKTYLTAPVHIAPLAVLRVLFGAMMVISAVRFLWLGWLDEQYLKPMMHFTFYGFAWVKPLSAPWLYAVYTMMLAAAAGMMLGFHYRISSVVFFLAFTYIELLDKAYYLNHYYFVSIVALLLMLVPAHGYFSLDALRTPSLKLSHVPRWTVDLFKLQVGIVYVFAGLAKLNSDWLLDAMPLRLWLPAHSDLPVIGALLGYEWTAYLFSWSGMLFDVTVVFFLMWRKSRPLAYLAVFLFHTLTGVLFPIGMFPLVMIMTTPIFFSARFHRRLLWRLRYTGRRVLSATGFHRRAASSIWASVAARRLWKSSFEPALLIFLAVHFSVQLMLPLRFLFYPDNLFWTEEGYRFSWRVMLMEKSGTATFYVKDAKTGREGAVDNREFLNATQEKQMSFQPDMILEYAHFLHCTYQSRGLTSPEVRAEVYVTLNGRPSRLYIDSTLNLARVPEGFAHKTWILPFELSPSSAQAASTQNQSTPADIAPQGLPPR